MSDRFFSTNSILPKKKLAKSKNYLLKVATILALNI